MQPLFWVLIAARSVGRPLQRIDGVKSSLGSITLYAAMAEIKLNCNKLTISAGRWASEVCERKGLPLRQFIISLAAATARASRGDSPSPEEKLILVHQPSLLFICLFVATGSRSIL